MFPPICDVLLKWEILSTKLYKKYAFKYRLENFKLPRSALQTKERKSEQTVRESPNASEEEGKWEKEQKKSWKFIAILFLKENTMQCKKEHILHSAWAPLVYLFNISLSIFHIFLFISFLLKM